MVADERIKMDDFNKKSGLNFVNFKARNTKKMPKAQLNN